MIDRDVFTKALKLRQQKAQTTLSGIGDIRKYMACACCHSKLKIDLGTREDILEVSFLRDSDRADTK